MNEANPHNKTEFLSSQEYYHLDTRRTFLRSIKMSWPKLIKNKRVIFHGQISKISITLIVISIFFRIRFLMNHSLVIHFFTLKKVVSCRNNASLCCKRIFSITLLLIILKNSNLYGSIKRIFKLAARH